MRGRTALPSAGPPVSGERHARGPARTVRLAGPMPESFPPVLPDVPRALVLGSMPGVRSLEESRYYAHPRNLFWPLMGELFGAGPELPYEVRLVRLGAHGVALWDVLASCERPGSLDARIVRATEVPNPIDALLAAHPSVHTVACNGSAALALFRRHIAPRIPADRVRVLALPSTSPANASIPPDAKRAAWRALAEAVSPPSALPASGAPGSGA